MLVHCFWLLDSNLGLNSEFVCSLNLFGKKEFGFENEKEKKKKRKQLPQTAQPSPPNPRRPSAAQHLHRSPSAARCPR
jgi:hypothetical protein